MSANSRFKSAQRSDIKLPILGLFLDNTVRRNHILSNKRVTLIHQKKVNKVWDEFFITLIDSLNSSLLIECGASDGSISSLAVNKVGVKAIAIEANPYTFETLTLKIEKYGVKALNAAVSDRDGELEFYIPLSGNLDSSSSTFKRKKQEVQIRKIRAITLTSLVKDLASKENRISLWIDVEGGGFEVLQGGLEIIQKICLIRIELEEETIWEGQKTAEASLKLLETQGFIPLICGPELSKGQRDWIFVRRSNLDDCVKSTLDLLNALEKIKVRKSEIFATIRLYDLVRFTKNSVIRLVPPAYHRIAHLIFSNLGSISSAREIEKK